MTRLLLALLLAAAAGVCGDDEGGGDDDPGMPDAPPTDEFVCVDEATDLAGNGNMVDGDPMLAAAATNTTAPDFAPTSVQTGGTPPAGFDTAATHIGAIGSTDWTEGWTAYPTNQVPASAGTTVDVGAAGTNTEISVDTTWESDTTYILKGPVFFTGGTLTIEAGTIIKGDAGSVLVITKDAQIDAQGTLAAPIVLTSSRASGSAMSGDWGGLVLLGEAPINVQGGTNTIEGFAAGTDGALVSYGGSTAAHDCGTVNYVRIEYAGYALSPDNELNGLTLGGCGTGTEIDHVQVHLGLDDGIEIFGGTVNIAHAVVTGADDDSFDFDLGWTGNAQFLIVQQHPTRGDKAVEADNQEDNNDATPRTNPQVWNFTFIGGGDGGGQGGLHLRRGMAGSWNNGIVTDFEDWAVDIDGSASALQFTGGTLEIANTILAGVGAGGEAFPDGFDDEDDTTNGPQNDCVPAE